MDEEAAAADAREPGLDSAQHQRGHDGRVHGVAAARENIRPGLRRMAVLGGDETVRRMHGRPPDAESLHQRDALKRWGALASGSRIGTLKRAALPLAA